jgi:hypothetical protein
MKGLVQVLKVQILRHILRQAGQVHRLPAVVRQAGRVRRIRAAAHQADRVRHLPAATAHQAGQVQAQAIVRRAGRVAQVPVRQAGHPVAAALHVQVAVRGEDKLRYILIDKLYRISHEYVREYA